MFVHFARHVFTTEVFNKDSLEFDLNVSISASYQKDMFT